MSVLASVIMPAYNNERFIEKAILSVVAEQGIDDLEMLVIDDRSTDSTYRLVSEMQKKYPQIRLLRNERKKGPAGGRNTGLLNATGKYISFLDADDLWLPGHLRQSINYCENVGVDIVFNDFSVIDYESGEHLFNWFEKKQYLQSMKMRHISGCLYVPECDMVEALLNEMFIHLQALVGKASCFDGVMFDDNVYVVDDLDYCIRLSKKPGNVFACTRDVTSIYHRHGKCITANGLQNGIIYAQNHIRLFESYLRDESFFKNIDTLRARLFQSYLELAYWMRKKQSAGEALRYTLGATQYGFSMNVLSELCKIGVSSFQNALSYEK